MQTTKKILVCCDTGCIANGSLAVVKALEECILASGADAAVEMEVKRTGCHGFCENGPVVKIMPDDISYFKVRAKDAAEIVGSLGSPDGAGSLDGADDADGLAGADGIGGIGKGPVERLLFRDDSGKRVTGRADNPFYAPQNKVALRNVGEIDPDSIEDFVSRGGYAALKIALSMSPEEIIAEVEKSGLRGRGGAGFPTGRKWRIAAGMANKPKYVVMNGDEGDPGAFMDRAMLEGDPHSIIEGIAICALAIGATEGFLYIRDEYTMALKTMKKAILAAESAGVLGSSVLGSEKSLHLSVVRGGGAFVCGESTALVASIEGNVGEPRAKYIRTVEQGLWGQPTVLNNVETFANIPVIILKGGAAFAATGTGPSKGTKVFTLVGKVRRSGLIEVPMGATLRQIVFDIGGGIPGNREFKAIQTGGPSGGCLPASLLDVPVDFDTLTKYGSMMGSGGMIVMDDRTCMVEVARYYTSFLARESCGKCTPCREGLRLMADILAGICEGKGQAGDVKLLGALCETITEASLCGLGKSAANPVLTTMKYFPEEYVEHIEKKVCRAGVCPMESNNGNNN